MRVVIFKAAECKDSKNGTSMRLNQDSQLRCLVIFAMIPGVIPGLTDLANTVLRLPSAVLPG